MCGCGPASASCRVDVWGCAVWLPQIGDTPDVGSAPNQKDMYSSFVGTVEYLAPEIIKDSGATGRPS